MNIFFDLKIKKSIFVLLSAFCLTFFAGLNFNNALAEDTATSTVTADSFCGPGAEGNGILGECMPTESIFSPCQKGYSWLSTGKSCKSGKSCCKTECNGEKDGTSCNEDNGSCKENFCYPKTSSTSTATTATTTSLATPTSTTTASTPTGTATKGTLSGSKYTISLDNQVGMTTAQETLGLVLGGVQKFVGIAAIFFLVLGGVLYAVAGIFGGNAGMITAAKTSIMSAIIGLSLVLAAPAFVNQIKTIGLGSSSGNIKTLSDVPTAQSIFERALQFLLSIVGVLAIIGLVMSGFLYLAAAANSAQAAAALKAMQYSIMGIAIASASLIIVKQIVALSINAATK